MRHKIRLREHRSAPGRSSAVSVLIAVLAGMLTISMASVAVAAGPPAATTNAATNVTSTSATLNATVFPNQNPTTYYFQYGTTPSYGTQTATQGPVGGNAGKAASADVAGLTPGTTYHFRIVASNSAGTSVGADATFTTPLLSGALPPAAQNTVTISATPASVTFGNATLIKGSVTGPANAGVQVTLEASEYPYTSGFKPTGLTTTTTSTGAYSLAVKPSVNTHYLVIAKTAPPTSSPDVGVTVRVRVGLRLSTLTPAVGQRVRFSGTVTPAHNGKLALIQRHTATGWKTVASATLVAATPVNGIAVSKYSRRLRINSTATYRVLVRPADGDHVAGTSLRRRIRVH